MSVNAILNADMATVRSWALGGLRWWISQLSELVPARWRIGGGAQGTLALFDGAGDLSYLRGGRPVPKPAQGDARVVLAIPEPMGLTRSLTVPRLGAADMRRLVELEIERLMPLPSDETLVAIQPLAQGGVSAASSAAVAILPRELAARAISAAISAQLVPTRVMLLPASEGGIRYDFTPVLREHGLLPTRSSPALFWWGLVGVAFLLNLVLLIVRDQQSVDRLAALVDAQAPAVTAARTIATRARQFELNADLLAAERGSHDVLGALGSVSAALPSGAWVQRYAWSGRSVRLTGYKRQGVDVLAALRHDPRFANVRSANSDVIAEIPAGQPFDITATLKGAAR